MIKLLKFSWLRYIVQLVIKVELFHVDNLQERIWLENKLMYSCLKIKDLTFKDQ